MGFHCFSCNNELEITDRVGRRDECLCGADIHVCLNCRFYDETAYNSCRESSAEVVRDKDRGNFCDFFEIGEKKGGENSKETLLAAAESLFKKK